ncbi:type II toxin-antitoxin system VapC family toxin [uncultured Brevundimonas sp.]|uniref:type II toxin-antitoxin system VapC family toxin n=1 Tax=uncultured Brevundimonas sp. TaxID=213418 RepID=UPI0030ED0FC0|tara:strand:- start:8360 stop:8773 length:414 start_codon:yes stop_codon:yes gene_type:complete
MTPVLVDSNVIFDVVAPLGEWKAWSIDALARAADRSALYINQIVYAEISAGYHHASEVDAILDTFGLDRDDMPWSAAFLAGRAYQTYRQRGGERRSPLPDFFIGAHAAVRRYTLLTRDARRYRTYFPGIDLICPDSD